MPERIVRATAEKSLLVVVDEQPKFMAAIYEAERVLSRTEFLLKIAAIVGVPVVATEQNVSRMGGSDPRIAKLLPASRGAIDKMSFSCCGCGDFMDAVTETGRKQAVIVGIETHICVSQTALDLLSAGWEVIVCPDSVSSRSLEMHKLGMERMRDAGVTPAHSEAVAYEWLGTAEHPRFRDALAVVKEHA